jgi:perosamine synthetase
MIDPIERCIDLGSDFIPLSEPNLQGREWEYVKECLDSGWVSSAGDYVDRFEKMTTEYLSVKYAVATVNGTAALHTALMAAGVRADDEVLVSTLAFIAPANAIRYCGAWPVFIDADRATWQIDPGKVIDFLKYRCHWINGELHNKATGRRIRAILPVHILGHPVDMDPILSAARKYGLKVIEDAAESLGATYKGKKAGRFGDIACLSFNGNKIITCGGGGMLVTNNKRLAERARYLTTQAKDDPVEYIHREKGYNYRLTNLQAALGCAQLEQLEDHIAAKRRIAATYRKGLETVPGIEAMPEAGWAFSTQWLYTALVKQRQYGLTRKQLMAALLERGIQTRPLWQPLHKSRAHRDCQAYQCGAAEALNRSALSLPCSVGLSEEDQGRVIEAVASLLNVKSTRRAANM